MYNHKHTYGCTECGMYFPPDSQLYFLFHQCEKCEDQEQHPCELSGHHGRGVPGKGAVDQSCDEQGNPISSVKACDMPDPWAFLCQSCALQRCERTEDQQQYRYKCEKFSNMFKTIPSGSNRLP